MHSGSWKGSYEVSYDAANDAIRREVFEANLAKVESQHIEQEALNKSIADLKAKLSETLKIRDRAQEALQAAEAKVKSMMCSCESVTPCHSLVSSNSHAD